MTQRSDPVPALAHVWLIERMFSFGWRPCFGACYQTRASARIALPDLTYTYTGYNFRIRKYIRSEP
jgi:hypothetical protein